MTTDDAMTLLGSVNPLPADVASALPLQSGEAELLRQIKAEPQERESRGAHSRHRMPRRRRFALAGGIAVVALAIGGVLGVRSINNPPSALAAEMDRLAQVAASQDWTGIPGPGQYLYTE